MQTASDVRPAPVGRASSPADEYARTAPYAWYVVVLLATVNVVNYMDRMAISVLASHIQADLHISDTQFGLMTGLAFALFYAVSGIPIARWADRGNRRNIISMALIAWSAMTALGGAAQNFWQLLLARIGVGAGEAGSFSPGASIVCDYVPLQRRSGALSIHAFGNAAGILVGMALAGWLGERVGWRWTLLMLALPGLGLAAVVRFSLREPKRGSFDGVRGGPQQSVGATIRTLWQCRTYRILMAFFIVNGFVQHALYQWWPSFYERTFHLGLSSVGISLGIAIGAGNGLGTLVGGVFADRAAKEDLSSPLKIGAIAMALAMFAVLASFFVASVQLSIVLVALAAFLLGVPAGPALAGAYSVCLASLRSTAGALLIFLTSVFGFGLGPFCVGLLSDALAPAMGHSALLYALLAPVTFVPVLIITLLAAAKALPADLRAVGAPANR